MARYNEAAKSSGSIILCCSGFDSIPVDLLNYAVAKCIRQKYNADTRNARTFITNFSGSVSGGTLASIFALLEVFSLRDISEAHAPWSLSTRKGSSLQRNVPHVTWDSDLAMYGGSWIGDSVDRSVAGRSWSILNYGPNWTTYGYLGFGAWYKAYAYLSALYFGTFIIGIPPIRYLLKKYVIQPGSGPSQKQRDSGFLEMQGIGESDDADRHKVKATFRIVDADPGYKGTAAMLACVALTLALDVGKTEAGSGGGGFWTPASLGESLVGRLDTAGITLQVNDI
ncbi:Putative uncharacterized protein [Taphrina deformans PYCC 5710]|uniref:Saccharopine dehydrogenase NADP binding domain-containing protein n=1 Tax=Taphrina deformans (strain PYCC 5710 / ATCC 11124 / CBS 356.35 / IMI 108563 / JCM 9778 / NBRC 8474) TaxID=1097556 RepID=R4XAA2_TAPDE|nr:Putative uncharacterized protein [Taphrina deformans PYCC 5710]|eukprot:CCG82733.1 Putative uncharacterized protein [Taphrina deformans PYCC 5710]